VAVLVGLERLYYFQNRGFRLSKLTSPQAQVDIAPSPEIDAMLDQNFRWIGGGGTSYVFLGDDGKTVLKLFKYHQLYFKHVLTRVCFPGVADGWRLKTILQREKKHAHKRYPSFFTSCAIVSSDFREETGLIYLCLQPNRHFNKEVQLIDAWGIPHTLNLSRTGFALQKKAELLFPYLEKLLEKEDGRRAIDALVWLVLRRCEKGIGDRDPNLLTNFGFAEERAVEFDLGSYYYDDSLKSPLCAARELFFTTVMLQKWLEKHSPQLLDYLLDTIATVASHDMQVDVRPHIFGSLPILPSAD
jgi:hypothetical protein